jgi:hypothetical protein
MTAQQYAALAGVLYVALDVVVGLMAGARRPGIAKSPSAGPPSLCHPDPSLGQPGEADDDSTRGRRTGDL